MKPDDLCYWVDCSRGSACVGSRYDADRGLDVPAQAPHARDGADAAAAARRAGWRAEAVGVSAVWTCTACMAATK